MRVTFDNLNCSPSILLLFSCHMLIVPPDVDPLHEAVSEFCVMQSAPLLLPPHTRF